MSDAASGSATTTTEEAVRIERIFDASRELVWKAWTEPERFVRWWGPHAFTTPECTIDLRPGGAILFRMRSEGTGDVWAGGVFREVVPPERLVFTDHFADEKGNPVSPATYGLSDDFPAESLITVVLEELDGGRTRLTLTHTVPASAPEQAGTGKGWNQSFEKLDRELAEA